MRLAQLRRCVNQYTNYATMRNAFTHAIIHMLADTCLVANLDMDRMLFYIVDALFQLIKK